MEKDHLILIKLLSDTLLVPCLKLLCLSSLFGLLGVENIVNSKVFEYLLYIDFPRTDTVVMNMKIKQSISSVGFTDCILPSSAPVSASAGLSWSLCLILSVLIGWAVFTQKDRIQPFL